MKGFGKIKSIAAFCFMAAFSAGSSADVIGSCDGGSGTFNSVGDQCQAISTIAPVASHEGGDVYSISIAAGSGITGLNLTGTQDGAGGQFSFTLLNDNGSPAGGTVGAFGGDVSGAFAVTAGNSYTLRYLGDNVTAYGLTLTAVPIPAAAWLFGSVLMALGVVGRKRRLGQVDQVAVPA